VRTATSRNLLSELSFLLHPHLDHLALRRREQTTLLVLLLQAPTSQRQIIIIIIIIKGIFIAQVRKGHKCASLKKYAAATATAQHATSIVNRGLQGNGSGGNSAGNPGKWGQMSREYRGDGNGSCADPPGMEFVFFSREHRGNALESLQTIKILVQALE